MSGDKERRLSERRHPIWKCGQCADLARPEVFAHHAGVRFVRCMECKHIDLRAFAPRRMDDYHAGEPAMCWAEFWPLLPWWRRAAYRLGPGVRRSGALFFAVVAAVLAAVVAFLAVLS